MSHNSIWKKIKKNQPPLTKIILKQRLNLSESFLPLSEDKGIMKLLHLQSLVLFLSYTIVWFNVLKKFVVLYNSLFKLNKVIIKL